MENLKAARDYRRKKSHVNKNIQLVLKGEQIKQMFHSHFVSSLSLLEKCKTS